LAGEPTTFISYGAFTTGTDVICESIKMVERYDSFSVSGRIIITKTTTAAAEAAGKILQDEIRKENQDLLITMNGVPFADFAPSANTAFAIRGDASIVFNGTTSLNCDFSFEGRLPPKARATGYYIFTMEFTQSQTERTTAVFSGTYTADGVSSASTLYEDGTNGAEVRCAALLTTYYAGRNFDMITPRLSCPEENDDWIQFSITYIERILPNAASDYDFGHITFTRTQMPFETDAMPGGGITYGVNWSGGLTAPDYPVQKWAIAGYIPVKSQSKNYADLMVEWESAIKPALWSLIDTYFWAQATIKSDYRQAFIENETTPFDVTENGISPNVSVLIPASGGIIEFAEALAYSLDPRYIVEYYLNGKDDFEAWIGKLPTVITCSQTARVTKLAVGADSPRAPQLPFGLSDIMWIQDGAAKLLYRSKNYKITDAANRTVSARTLEYVCNWKLISESSFAREAGGLT
jgi:hypothetical protein